MLPMPDRDKILYHTIKMYVLAGFIYNVFEKITLEHISDVTLCVSMSVYLKTGDKSSYYFI